MKKTAIVFYTYLPPWRIDIFNKMGEFYNLTLVFTDADSTGFIYNRKILLKKLNNVKTIFIKGFKFKNHSFHFGIGKLLNDIKPDIVFSHEYNPVSVYLSALRMINPSRFRYYITTSDNISMLHSAHGLKAIARHFVLSHANGIIVYSNEVKQWYEKKFSHVKCKICPNIQDSKSILNHTPDFEKYKEQYQQEFSLKNTPVVLYVGRCEYVKGLDLMLNAFSKIDMKEYKLVIVGDGSSRAKLESMCEELGIKDRVIFTGNLYGSALYSWYNLANFFILPSRHEPFGAVVNEALALGCPVLASQYIGALEFINETNGDVFDPLDEADFIIKMNRACTRYMKLSLPRKDLMLHSFTDYVNVFKEIDNI